MKDFAVDDVAPAEQAQITGEQTKDVQTEETVDFSPGPETTRAFRDALGRFATGVTVVTAFSEQDGPVGMTANSFSSVSLDPPLILWCAAKSSRRFQYFDAAPRFAVHVLRAEQASVGSAFARNADAFAETEWRLNEHGVPLLDGCLARFECAQAAAHDAGDHVIFIGRVERARVGDGEPLVFFAGGFSQLALTA